MGLVFGSVAQLGAFARLQPVSKVGRFQPRSLDRLRAKDHGSNVFAQGLWELHTTVPLVAEPYGSQEEPCQNYRATKTYACVSIYVLRVAAGTAGGPG
jgi:hypothetical protein